MQLFARDSTGHANVDFLGRVQAQGYAYLSVVKSRDKARAGYQKKNLQYNNSQASFSFTFQIKAELAAYTFDMYACKSATDSTLILRRDNIVAGDFYIIYGQSNAVAWEVDYKYSNEFARTYGSVRGSGAVWGLANEIGRVKDWVTFDVNGYNDGQYVLRVYYGDKASTRKILLIR